MKKFTALFILIILIFPALAQESMRYISYYPTSYASYNNITANEAVVGGQITAGQFKTDEINVGGSLNTEQFPALKARQVTVGANDAKGTMRLSTAPVAGVGILRLNQTLSGAVTAINATELHLIDGPVMTNGGSTAQLFPSPRMAKPNGIIGNPVNTPGMIWKEIIYLTTPGDYSSAKKAVFLTVNDGGTQGAGVQCSPACTGQGQYCNTTKTPPECNCPSAYDYFDTVAQKCISCAAEGKEFNQLTQTCVASCSGISVPAFSSPSATNVAPSQTTASCACPGGTFSTDSGGIRYCCPFGSVFDSASKMCNRCSASQTWNTISCISANEALAMTVIIRNAQDTYYAAHGSYATTFAALGITGYPQGTCAYGGCTDARVIGNWVYDLYPHQSLAHLASGNSSLAISFYNTVLASVAPDLPGLINKFGCQFLLDGYAAFNRQVCISLGGVYAYTAFNNEYYILP